MTIIVCTLRRLLLKSHILLKLFWFLCFKSIWLDFKFKFKIVIRDDFLEVEGSNNDEILDIIKVVSFYSISSKPHKAIEIGLNYLKELINNKPNFSCNDLFPVIDLLNYTQSKVFKQAGLDSLLKHLLCLSYYVGGLLAIRRSYYSIVPYLFQNVMWVNNFYLIHIL